MGGESVVAIYRFLFERMRPEHEPLSADLVNRVVCVFVFPFFFTQAFDLERQYVGRLPSVSMHQG